MSGAPFIVAGEPGNGTGVWGRGTERLLLKAVRPRCRIAVVAGREGDADVWTDGDHGSGAGHGAGVRCSAREHAAGDAEL